MHANARVEMGKKIGKKKQRRKKGKKISTCQPTRAKEVMEEDESDSEREISLEDAQRLASLSKLGAT